jgi:hypothetical protein
LPLASATAGAESAATASAAQATMIGFFIRRLVGPARRF